MLKAYNTYDLVHNMAYMMDPIKEAYGIPFIISSLDFVLGNWDDANIVPCGIGNNPLL